MNLLTQKQETVYTILQNFFTEQGRAPSLTELQNALLEIGFAVKSRRGVVQYLEALQKHGLIERSSEERGIRLIQNKESKTFFDIPLLGYANAGAAHTFAEENVRGYLKVSKRLIHTTENVFAIEVVGDSMNQCQVERKYIEDGDYIVIDKNVPILNNNDIVLAVIDGYATVKKFNKSIFGEIRLMPQSSNPVHQPIFVHQDDNFMVNGKVINVLKAEKNSR